MLPGAAISGRVTTASGAPAPGIAIAVVDVRRVGGTVSSPLRGTTDDRGIYRVFGLPPGDYLVSALPRLVSTAEGRGVGRSTGVVQVTEADVQWARTASTSGIARATPAGSTTPASPRRFVAYAPVFHPGVTDVTAAAPVSVAAGEERSDIGLTLRVVPMARIGGTLVDQSGQPVTTASVALYPPRSMQPTPADALVTSGALVLPRGTVSPAGFSIPGVAPGRYTLVARTGGGRRGSTQPPDAAPTLWSITDLLVDGSDQTDLVLRLLPGVRISGRIAFDASSVTPPDDLSRTDLSLAPAGSSIGIFTTPRAIVDVRGQFEFRSVAPGPYTLRTLTNLLPNGGRWTLKSAMLAGRDLADGAFEIKPGADLAGLTLTFTDRAAEISGRLIDTEGRPVTRYSIVVFTVDRALWLPDARRIKHVQPATDGSFVVGGLPAGPYAIAAVEEAGAGDLGDPAFLSQLLAAAFKVTLADGERKRQDLRVGSR
jgi:protocatechuate 3,4-dioxygenase beta subunit